MRKTLDFIKKLFLFVRFNLFYRYRFKNFGIKSLLFKPLILLNPQNISIGEQTFIMGNSRLEVVTDRNKNASLEICDNVNIEQNVHIVCGNYIKIGRNVSITANCAIVDILHPYSGSYEQIKIGSRLDCSKTLEIGDGSFIGIGSVILPGANIGKNCVIGANSVVTKPIPDHCIAAGNPARVIKKYDFDKNEWIKV